MDTATSPSARRGFGVGSGAGAARVARTLGERPAKLAGKRARSGEASVDRVLKTGVSLRPPGWLRGSDQPSEA